MFNYITKLFQQLPFVDLTKMHKVRQIHVQIIFQHILTFTFHSSVLDPELRYFVICSENNFR